MTHFLVKPVLLLWSRPKPAGSLSYAYTPNQSQLIPGSDIREVRARESTVFTFVLLEYFIELMLQ